MIKLPFVIYYDTEAMLENIENENSNTYQLHHCRHVGIKLVSNYPELLKNEQIYI